MQTVPISAETADGGKSPEEWMKKNSRGDKGKHCDHTKDKRLHVCLLLALPARFRFSYRNQVHSILKRFTSAAIPIHLLMALRLLISLRGEMISHRVLWE